MMLLEVLLVFLLVGVLFGTIWELPLDNLLCLLMLLLLSTLSLSQLLLLLRIAYTRYWDRLWLEIDSQLVVLAFNSPSTNPWNHRNHWLNCLTITKSFGFMISDIYPKGNNCAERHINFAFGLWVFFGGIPFWTTSYEFFHEQIYFYFVMLHSFFLHLSFILMCFLGKIFNETTSFRFLLLGFLFGPHKLFLVLYFIKYY